MTPTRPSTRRARTLALALGLALAAAACGGSGDGCTGYVTINETPTQCQMIAEQFGCTVVEASGTSCGLSACATCIDL